MIGTDEQVAWLQGQRWFFEKGVEIAAVEPVWQYRILDDTGDIDLSIQTITFGGGTTSSYFIPVYAGTSTEAIDSPIFHRWLLQTLNDSSISPAELQWTRIGTGLPSGMVDLAGTLMGVEQSNS